MDCSSNIVFRQPDLSPNRVWTLFDITTTNHLNKFEVEGTISWIALSVRGCQYYYHLQARRSQTKLCSLSLLVRLDFLGHKAKTGMTAQRMKCTGPHIPPQGARLTWCYITTESGTPFLQRRLIPEAEVEDIQELVQVLGVLPFSIL